jgi:hypothetical protein
MPTDDHVHSHGFDGHGSVDEGFAFGEAAGAGGEVDGVSPQTSGGKAEAGAGAGGVFEEEVGDNESFEEVEPLATAVGGLMERVSEVEDCVELVCREFFELQQMLLPPGAGTSEFCEFQRHAAILEEKEWENVAVGEFIPAG